MRLRVWNLSASLIVALGSVGSCALPSHPLAPTTSVAVITKTQFVPWPALSPGMTISDGLVRDTSYGFIGEPDQSDYCTACRFYTLTVSADADVRVDLRWPGTPVLGLWSASYVEDTITRGTPITGTAATTLSLTVPRGFSVNLIVGTPYPTPAPATSVAFTITATRLPSQTFGNIR